ncbi:hypothetical protein BH09SUM1_BH09SUM1_34540 [soil metagenome]
MAQDEIELVDLALQGRLLTRKQADLVREELSMFPGQKAGGLMLRRHYVTEEQLDDLRQLASEGAVGNESVDEEDSMDAHDEEAPAAGPPAQLSVAQLKAGAAPPPNVRNAVAAAGKEGAPGPASQGPPPAVKPIAAQAAPAAPAQQMANQPKTLVGFLRLARHWGASDLHLSTGRPPFVRLGGQLRYLEMDPLTPERAMELNFSTLTDQQQAMAREMQQLDFALEIPGVGRHRCNVFKQRLGWDGSYRIVRADIPTIEELGLPANVRQFTEYHQGLVMVTGSGGAGKTTTVAALVNLVNQHRKDHIITVEDPVEYVITPINCQVTQREVGRHTQSFANALRAALREDPDIILVGELRDLETTSIAISAAETGHLVFSTLHTSSASRTVARIVDVYPIAQQSQVSTMVAESLRGVITQQLLPRRDKQGQVLAYEILVNTSGVAQQIKEAKTHMITSLIQTGKKYGMALMEETLMALLKNGTISGREAYRRATNKAPFDGVKDQD